MNVGGVHLTSGVDPDIGVFGKAFGNGFPISAVVGKRSVMEAAQDTFVSSTFWTERTGFVAALATLAKVERENVPQQLIYFGERISAGWRKLGSNSVVNVKISGIPPLTHIQFLTKVRSNT